MKNYGILTALGCTLLYLMCTTIIIGSLRLNYEIIREASVEIFFCFLSKSVVYNCVQNLTNHFAEIPVFLYFLTAQ